MSYEIKKLGEIISENPKSKIKVRESLDKGKYIFFKSGEKTRFLDSYLCKGKNIFLATGGKAVVKFYEGNAAYSTDTYSIKGKDNIVLTKYIFYFILSNIKKIGEKMFLGAAIKHLQKKDFKALLVNLPPLQEQKRMIKIIDKTFKGIFNAKKNTEKNLKNAKEVLESYLIKVFNNPGKNWEDKKVGEVCDLYQGLAINAKTKHLLVEKSDYPLLRIKDLRNNTQEKFVNFKGVPKNSFVNENEIIYTRTGNSLGLVFIGRRGVLHNNSFKIIPKSSLNNEYLFWWLQNKEFKSKIFKLASKTAQPDITHKIFKIQLIKIPPKNIQKIIITKIINLSKEIKRLEYIYKQKISSFEELKKSILKEAFSGELIGVKNE